MRYFAKIYNTEWLFGSGNEHQKHNTSKLPQPKRAEGKQFEPPHFSHIRGVLGIQHRAWFNYILTEIYEEYKWF